MTQTTEAPYSSARREFTRLESEEDLRRLFDLDTLRRSLFEHKDEAVKKDWEETRQLLLNASDTQRAELLFSHRLLATYGSSMPLIRYMLESTPPVEWQASITEHRQELIDRMAGTEAGKHWMRCMRQKGGWKFTAIYLWGERSRVTSEAIDLFFLMLDEISILTDFLAGRSKDYGYDFKTKEFTDYGKLKEYIYGNEGKARKIIELLNQSIAGKKEPKTMVMPIRAAYEAGAVARIPHNTFEEIFDPENIVKKSSYNEYIDLNNRCYNDPAFASLIEEFQQYV